MSLDNRHHDSDDARSTHVISTILGVLSIVMVTLSLWLIFGPVFFVEAFPPQQAETDAGATPHQNMR